MANANLQALANSLQDRGTLRDLRCSRPKGSLSVSYRNVSIETEVQPGDLYVNLYGRSELAHQRIREAVSKGAVAVCCEMPPDTQLSVPVILVDQPRHVLSFASAFLYDFPAHHLTVIGVTGSNGKSTTTVLLTRCLAAAGVPCGLIGSVAQCVGETARPAGLTTPDAPEMHRLLRDMVDAGMTHAVLEVSSHGILHERVRDVSFTAALVTNIHEEHTDTHKDREEYISVKSRMFRDLPSSGLAVFNCDDIGAVQVAERSPAFPVAVGKVRTADVLLEGTDLVFGERLAARAGRLPERMSMELQVPGSPNRLNAALAASMAYGLGLPTADIQRALVSFPGLPRRYCTVYEGEFRIIDDMAMNPASAHCCFDLLEQESTPPDKLLVIVGVRGNRGPGIVTSTADVIRQRLTRMGVRRLVASLSRDTVGPADSVSPEEQKAFVDVFAGSGIRLIVCETLRKAMEYGLKRVPRRGTLLLMGAQNMEQGVSLLWGRMTQRKRGWFARPANGRWRYADHFEGVKEALYMPTPVRR